MSVNEPTRVKLRVISWSEDNQSGVVVDREGCHHSIHLEDMSSEFRNPELPIQLGEIVEGFVVDYDRVIGIVSGQRECVESLGPSPELEGWEPNLETPGTGQIRIGK